MAIEYAEREEVALTQSPDDDLLNPRQAAQYLAMKWQRPFTAKDFNNLRNNAQARAKAANKPLSEFFPIEPALIDTRLTLWRRSDLDKLVGTIEPPRYREEIRGKGKRSQRDIRG